MKPKYFSSLFAIVMVMVFFLPTWADIEKEFDDFDECMVYRSVNRIKDENAIISLEVKSKNQNFISGTFDVAILSLHVFHHFAEKPMKMKVSGNIINLENVKVASDKLATIKETTAEYKVSFDSLDELKNAKKVTIRLYKQQADDLTWAVPDKILNEWKELISMAGI